MPSNSLPASHSAARAQLPAALIFALVLLVSAVRLPALARDFLTPAWPAILQWSDPAAQARLSTYTPYDLLQAADAALPHDAAVLLVTPGHPEQVRLQEYTAYHRALYYLAPRPVWWLAPAERDGTWESRSWTPGPITAGAIGALAADKRAQYVLLLGVAPPEGLGTTVLARGDGALVRLGAEEPVPGAAPGYAGQIWPLQIALATVVILAAGDLVLRGAARIGPPVTGVARWSLAWLLGIGLTTLAMLAMSAVGVALTAQIIAWSAVIGTGWTVTAVVGRGVSTRTVVSARQSAMEDHHDEVHDAAAPPGDTGRRRAVSRLICAVLGLWIALHIALVAVLALGRPLEAWDSWAIWGMKARAIWRDQGIPVAVYGDHSRVSTLPSYPLLVPLAEAWYYGWLGAPDDRLAGVQSLAFYLALLGLTYASARAGAGRTIARAAVAVVCALQPIVLAAGFVFADVALAACALGAVTCWRAWQASGSRAALLVAAICAGLMPWAKREGWLLLLAFFVVALLVTRGDRRTWRGLAALAASAVMLAGPWALFAALRAVPGVEYLPLTPMNVAANLARLPVLAGLALRELLQWPWAGLWPLAAVYAVVRWRQTRHNIVLPATALLYLTLVAVSYLLSDYVPYQAHFASSYGRLALQVAPLVVVWIATACPARRGDYTS